MAPARRSWLARLFGGGDKPESPAAPSAPPSRSHDAAPPPPAAPGTPAPETGPALDALFGAPPAAPDDDSLSVYDDEEEVAPPVPAFSPGAVAPSGPEESGDRSVAPVHRAVSAPAVVLRVVIHIAGTGDVAVTGDGWVGTPGAAIEGLSVIAEEGIDPEDIECRVVSDDGSLTEWVPGDRYSGTRGESRPLRGYAVRLVGPAVSTHLLRYRAAFAGGIEVGPLADGAICAAPGGALLEAVQVLVTPAA